MDSFAKGSVTACELCLCFVVWASLICQEGAGTILLRAGQEDPQKTAEAIGFAIPHAVVAGRRAGPSTLLVSVPYLESSNKA